MTTRDSSGNERTCEFDVLVPVDEQEMQLAQTITNWDFPLQQYVFEDGGLLFFTHTLSHGQQS